MKLVILDRDGVINEDSDAFVKSVAEWIPLPGSIDAIARLSKAGFQVVIATNQSGLGRGLFTLEELHGMHGKLASLVAEMGGSIAGIYFCLHAPEAGCRCRKPAPGMFDDISARFGSLGGVPAVGDSVRDLEAGVARGCEPILVRTGKGKASEKLVREHEHPAIAQAKVFEDLAAVADHLLSGDGRE